jgi:hypothetical protein
MSNTIKILNEEVNLETAERASTRGTTLKVKHSDGSEQTIEMGTQAAAMIAQQQINAQTYKTGAPAPANIVETTPSAPVADVATDEAPQESGEEPAPTEE